MISCHSWYFEQSHMLSYIKLIELFHVYTLGYNTLKTQLIEKASRAEITEEARLLKVHEPKYVYQIILLDLIFLKVII